MITQVSGPNTVGVTKDPRRKAQSVKFKKNEAVGVVAKLAKEQVSGHYAKPSSEYYRQQQTALWTSVSIVLGAVLLPAIYFIFSEFKKIRK